MVLLGQHKSHAFGIRVDVQYGQKALVLPDFSRGYFAADDFAEYAVFHIVMLITNSVIPAKAGIQKITEIQINSLTFCQKFHVPSRFPLSPKAPSTFRDIISPALYLVDPEYSLSLFLTSLDRNED